MASAAAQPATAGNSASHPYTCNTCQVAYRNIDLQKGHMKSDWHRYNLKRRVASLPPISADVFTEKVIQARAVTTAEADKAYFERACEVCQKTYYSENAYQNHLSSQKHKVKLSSSDSPRADDEATSVVSSSFSLGDPIPVRRNSVDSDAEEEFNQVIEGFSRSNISAEQRPSPVKRPSNPQPAGNETEAKEAQNGRESNNTTPVQSQAVPAWSLKSCIFCNYSSPTVPLNVHHMERFHGMFIPEKPYLVNLDGLIDQLQHRVHDGHECLYCGKISSTVFGVQTHMRDKGHCKIPFTTEQEQLDIGEFYDFRSTYSDEEDEEEDEEDANGGAKLGAKRAAKVTGPDGEDVGEENGDGWETDSSASSLDSEELTGVPADHHLDQFERLGKHPHHSSHDPRHRHQADGWHSHAHKHNHAAFYDEYELHLPTGKSVGHRSMNKYYRQNLHNYPSAEERTERQLLEDGGADNGAENGENNQVARQSRGRAMVPRGVSGMAGVSDHNKELVKKAEQRGRTQEDNYAKKKDYAYGKKLNNQKNYYYRFAGGG
jgi:pre-60S factor REI1